MIILAGFGICFECGICLKQIWQIVKNLSVKLLKNVKMRIDNSAWGSRDFVEKLVVLLRESRLSRDAALDEATRLLKERIDTLKRLNESLKYLEYAINERIPLNNRRTTTISNLMKTKWDELKCAIDNAR